MAAALRRCVESIDASVVVISISDEAWLGIDELVEIASGRGAVSVLSFDSKRYVGAQIGIHSPAGERVGSVSHLRNTEHLVVCGAARDVARAVSGEAAPVRAG
jgi:adenine-specific DNA-methyltransferase